MSDQFFTEENWVSEQGGLPKLVERIVTHLKAKNPEWDRSRQISTAISTIKRLCAGDSSLPGKQTINAKSRAEACAALAQWEKMKADSKADNAVHPSPTVSLPMSEKFDAEPETDTTVVHSYGEPIGDVEHGIAQWAREWLADHPVEAQRLKDLTTG